MTSGRDEYMEKKCIDYEAENRKRYEWVTKTGGAAHLNLTLRDYFAAKAFGVDCYGISSIEAMAIKAYRVADAMMKAREMENIDEGDGIEALELSIRAENVLKSEDIKTIEELTKRSKYDLLKLPNCGPTTVREIVTQLNRRGLTLRGLR